jgi:hypothetical protein
MLLLLTGWFGVPAAVSALGGGQDPGPTVTQALATEQRLSQAQAFAADPKAATHAAALAKLVPAKMGIRDLQLQLQQLADQQGVNIATLLSSGDATAAASASTGAAPAAAAAGTAAASRVVQITGSATSAASARAFVAGIASLPRLVVVDQLTLAGGGTGKAGVGSLVTLTLTLHAVALSDDQEATQ